MSHELRAMGCAVVVGGASARERRAVEALFAEREQVFSRFVPGSELNRVNAAAGAPVRVSQAFADMLALALDAARETDGLVDPALGRALEAAGYDRDFAALAPDPAPAGDPGPVRAAVRLSGRIVLVPAGVQLDLNGVVKSRTVDDALELIRGDGFVSAGGDLAARGGLVAALPGGEVVRLVQGALATSGSNRRRWLRGGRVQHHLIDPATGRPADVPWEQVTVCASTCTGADIAAKAAFLLGEAGPDWLDERGLPGRFLTGEGEIRPNRSWTTSLARAAVCI